MKKLLNKTLMVMTASLFGVGSTTIQASDPITVNVNGNKVAFNAQQPEIINAVTYVPIRGVFEELGYTVSWEQQSKSVNLAGHTDRYMINTLANNVTGSLNKTLENKVLILNNSTMLPLREISQIVGAQVKWDQQTKVIDIVNGEGSNNSTLPQTSLLSETEMSYLKEAYRMSEEKLEQDIALAEEYLDGYTYADVIEGKNEEFAEKYALLHSDLSAFEALEVPSSLQELHNEVIELKNEYTEVIMDLILNGYTEKHQLEWETYIAAKSALEEKFTRFYEDKKVNVEESFGIDIFSIIPFV